MLLCFLQTSREVVNYARVVNLGSRMCTSFALTLFQLEKLWQLFDFDRNGSLDDVEAEIMLECVVRG